MVHENEQFHGSGGLSATETHSIGSREGPRASVNDKKSEGGELALQGILGREGRRPVVIPAGLSCFLLKQA
jgi:hypothetical protein